MINQAKGGWKNVSTGEVFDPSHYCDVNWLQTGLYGGLGGVIGAVVAAGAGEVTITIYEYVNDQSGTEGSSPLTEDIGRGLTPDERVRINRIQAMNIDVYIAKHPLALTDPADGRYVVETGILIAQLSNSIKVLYRALRSLNNASKAEAVIAITEGETKRARLIAWLSQNSNWAGVK